MKLEGERTLLGAHLGNTDKHDWSSAVAVPQPWQSAGGCTHLSRRGILSSSGWSSNMVPGIYPTVDYAFKKVFGSESDVPVLLNLLDAVLKPLPDRRIVGLEIRNPFNSKDSADDKLSILDIKARDREGRQYNVEMQMLGLGVYPQRVLYYWAALHSQQLHEGDSYGKLRPTISISFVNSVLFPDVRDHHLNFQLRSLDHPNLVFSEHQSIHVIELPKFRRSAEELVDPLDVWCYFLKHGAELDTDKEPRRNNFPISGG
jgi:predicted transposase/invertase (TIGR01784 family)